MTLTTKLINTELMNIKDQLILLGFNVHASIIFSNHLIVEDNRRYSSTKVKVVNIDYQSGSDKYIVNGIPLRREFEVLSYCQNIIS